MEDSVYEPGRMARWLAGNSAGHLVARLLWLVVGVSALLVVLAEIGANQRPVGFSLSASLTNGLQVGAVYALVALGVALVYRATGVVNFAQGELGSFPAFIVLLVLSGGDIRGRLVSTADITLLQMLGVTALAILVGAALAVLINIGIVQRLSEASAVTGLVATVGVTLLLIAAQLILFEPQRYSFPRYLGGAPPGIQIGPMCFATLDDGVCQGSAGNFAIGGLTVPWNTFIIFGVLIVVSLALAAFFRTPLGVALMASSQEPFAAELYGVSPVTMSSLAWALAGAFGALAGILGGGVFEGVSPGFMTAQFLIPGLVGAVLGGITSMVGAVVGGLALGVVFSLANVVVLELALSQAVPGAEFLAAIVVLVTVLIVRPRGLFGKAG